MKTLKFQIAPQNITDHIHGECGDCLTECPNIEDIMVGSWKCTHDCPHCVSCNHDTCEVVCLYPEEVV